MTGDIHIAGMPVWIGDRWMRQRCAWCGEVLLNYDLSLVAVPVGQESDPGTWEIGALVLMDGGMAAVVPHADGDPLPDEACAKRDPEVTRWQQG